MKLKLLKFLIRLAIAILFVALFEHGLIEWVANHGHRFRTGLASAALRDTGLDMASCFIGYYALPMVLAFFAALILTKGKYDGK